jgi:hypothetical protein
MIKPLLAFQRTGKESSGKILLAQGIKDNKRYNQYGEGGKNMDIVCKIFSALEAGHHNHHRREFWVLQKNSSEEQIVPGVGKIQNHQGQHHGF